jgi:orotate phosphoribosyltransferase-like protein
MIITQVSQVLREHAIEMQTSGMSTRAVARELNVNFSTIYHIQHCFSEFGSTSHRSHNRWPCVWRCVGELMSTFADVNFVMVGLWYEQA